MRTARINDHWRRIAKRKYLTYLESINLNGCIGINEINFGDGIRCICGLNGAGKSTIIAAIKAIIGLPLEEQDQVKIETNIFEGTFIYNSEEIRCSSIKGNRLIDIVTDIECIKYIDASRSIRVLDFFLHQENIDELIEQSESTELDTEIVAKINYLVGKNYQKIQMYELDDILGFDTIPFFVVSEGNMEYDTRKMGMGEHFLFYIYWMLLITPKNSLVVIEEPETFVGVNSQRGIMNTIAMMADEKGCSFLITTHSPYILQNVSDNHINILARASGMVSIRTVNDQNDIDTLLGIKQRINGTFFVEDEMAKIFLSQLLKHEAPSLSKRYLIEIAQSSSQISQCLQFIKTDNIRYSFVGVYDADQKEKIDGQKLKWPFVFLPVEKDVEREILKYLSEKKNVINIAKKLGKEEDVLVIALNAVSGENYHDKIIDLCRNLSVELVVFIGIFYTLWKKENVKNIENFMCELYEYISNSDY